MVSCRVSFVLQIPGFKSYLEVVADMLAWRSLHRSHCVVGNSHRIAIGACTSGAVVLGGGTAEFK